MSQPWAGKPEAAAVVWQWQSRLPPGPEADASSRSRRRGVLQAVGGGVVGLGVYQFLSATIGSVVLGIASVILLSALISPTGLYAGIERLFEALGRLTGSLLTWLLLVPLFYLFFLPFGKLMRRGRRDRLKRFLDPDTGSYWEPHEGPTAGSASHERQF